MLHETRQTLPTVAAANRASPVTCSISSSQTPATSVMTGHTSDASCSHRAAISVTDANDWAWRHLPYTQAVVEVAEVGDDSAVEMGCHGCQ